MANRPEMVFGKMVKVNQIEPAAFEPLVIYKCLQDPVYMGTVINYLKPEYFSNEHIKDIICLPPLFTFTLLRPYTFSIQA